MNVCKVCVKAVLVSVTAVAVGLLGAGCGEDKGPAGPAKKPSDAVKWDDEPNGLLEVINGTGQDMVIFYGMIPNATNLLGGVRAGVLSRKFDLRGIFHDYAIGGAEILRGMSKDEYDKHANNLAGAKTEFSELVTYGENKPYRATMRPNYIGDYGFEVINSGKLGMELRKDHPMGEKISYVSPYTTTPQVVYAESTRAFSVYPAYVYYSRLSGTITILDAIKLGDPLRSLVQVQPDPDPKKQRYFFPDPNSGGWEAVVSTLKSPVAYVTVNNLVTNQTVYLTIAASAPLDAQNGYDAVGSGREFTFPVESTEDGSIKALVLLVRAVVQVPARFEDAAVGELPILKNGYDYHITLRLTGTDVLDPESYSAVLVEKGKRDLSDEITSL